MKYCAAIALMLIVAACAMGGAHKAAAPQESSMPSVAPSQLSPRGELNDTYARLEQQRVEMGLPEPGESAPGPIQMATQQHPTSQNDNACHPAQSDTCESSCKLSDSICKNADRICELAKDLEPDADAAAKCTKADKTCKAAHDKCCGCML